MNTLSSPIQDVPLKGESPHPTVSLESILCTEELQGRPSRPPDYEKENRALVKLVSALADSPSTIFQTLAETILDITHCDSAGQLSRACGIPTSGVERPATSDPAETCSIKIVPCCSDISNAATPICSQSFRQPKSVCWSPFMSTAKRSEPSGRSCTATVASSMQRMTESWPLWENSPPQPIKRWPT